MKKLVSLFLVLFLLSGIAFASSYSVYTWCEELPRNATFMFDYRLMSPIRTARPLGRIPAPNYILTGAYVAGFAKKELNPDAYVNGEANVVPVSVVENGTYVYPIVTCSNAVVGLVWVTTENGTATVFMKLRDQVSNYHNQKFILRVYSCIDEVVYDGMEYDFEEPFIVEEDVFYFEINGVVSYPDVIGSTKIGNCCAYYKLAEYNRYDYPWKSYRTYLMGWIKNYE